MPILPPPPEPEPPELVESSPQLASSRPPPTAALSRRKPRRSIGRIGRLAEEKGGRRDMAAPVFRAPFGRRGRGWNSRRQSAVQRRSGGGMWPGSAVVPGGGRAGRGSGQRGDQPTPGGSAADSASARGARVGRRGDDDGDDEDPPGDQALVGAGDPQERQRSADGAEHQHTEGGAEHGA